MRGIGVILVLCASALHAQDDVVKAVQLDAFTVSAQALGFKVEDFVKQVMEDTTFQQAFVNLKCHPHRVESALRVHHRKERKTAGLYRRGMLLREGGKVWLALDSLAESGPLRNQDGSFRYLTAEMYDDVFFPKGRVPATCNIVQRQQEIVRTSKFDKYKSELKKFMFNPGQEIASVPMIGDKLALFDPKMVPYYDYFIRAGERNGHLCWVFSADARPEARDGRTVIKRMETWFDRETMQVIAREYRIAHASLILDFDIRIKVDNQVLEGQLLPAQVDYEGVWDIPFKPTEQVRFFLTLSDWQVAQ
ncbi:MAG: hypothetical protein JNM31_14055 [Flavobacteriales bacterium]|nr:hypothetical protein [Flavobacteriales bacterium]